MAVFISASWQSVCLSENLEKSVFPKKKGKKRNKNGCHLESIIEAHNGVVENAVVSEHFSSSFWKFKLSRSRKKHKCFASVLYKKKSYAAAGRRKT